MRLLMMSLLMIPLAIGCSGGGDEKTTTDADANTDVPEDDVSDCLIPKASCDSTTGVPGKSDNEIICTPIDISLDADGNGTWGFGEEELKFKYANHRIVELLTSDEKTSYTYDDNGLLSTYTEEFYENGELVFELNQNLSYDLSERLSKIQGTASDGGPALLYSGTEVNIVYSENEDGSLVEAVRTLSSPDGDYIVVSTYDEHERVIKRTFQWPNSDSETRDTFTYDSNGNLMSWKTTESDIMYIHADEDTWYLSLQETLYRSSHEAYASREYDQPQVNIWHYGARPKRTEWAINNGGTVTGTVVYRACENDEYPSGY